MTTPPTRAIFRSVPSPPSPSPHYPFTHNQNPNQSQMPMYMSSNNHPHNVPSSSSSSSSPSPPSFVHPSRMRMVPSVSPNENSYPNRNANTNSHAYEDKRPTPSPSYLSASSSSSSYPSPPLPPSSSSPSSSSSSSSLYIRHLPLSIRQLDLNRLFSSFGPLVHSKILFAPSSSHGIGSDSQSQSRGVAFVRFVSPSSAMLAMAELDGKPLQWGEHRGDKNLFVKFAKEREGEGEEEGGMGMGEGTWGGRKYEHHHGDHRFPSDREDNYGHSEREGRGRGRGRGSGSDRGRGRGRGRGGGERGDIPYGGSSAADSLESSPQPPTVLHSFPRDRHILLSSSVPRGRDPTNLYVVDLPLTVHKNDIFALFSPYGKVLSAAILMDQQAKVSRGIGLIRFETKENAWNAYREMQGVMLPGALKPMRIRFARDAMGEIKEISQYLEKTTENDEKEGTASAAETSSSSHDKDSSPSSNSSFSSFYVLDHLSAYHRGVIPRYIDPMRIDYSFKFKDTMELIKEENRDKMRRKGELFVEEIKKKMEREKEKEKEMEREREREKEKDRDRERERDMNLSYDQNSSPRVIPSTSPTPLDSSTEKKDFSSAWLSFLTHLFLLPMESYLPYATQYGLPNEKEQLQGIIQQIKNKDKEKEEGVDRK